MFFSLIYIVQFIFVLLFRDRINNVIAGIYLALCWVFLFTFRGYDYGLDIVTYYNIFLDSNYYELDEPGLIIINQMLKFISTDLAWFNYSYAIIINLSVLFFFRSSTKFYVVCFVLFSTSFLFYQFNLNIFRQGLANTLSIIILIRFLSNRTICFLFLVIPVLIHKSSLIFFLYLLVGSKFCNRKVIVAILVSLAFPIFSSVSDTLIKLSSSIFPILADALAEYQRVESLNLVGSSVYNHRNIPILVAILLVFKDYCRVNVDTRSRYLASYMLFSFMLASIFSANVLLYDRLVIPAQLISVIFIVEYFKSNFLRFSDIVISILLLSSSIFTVYFWGPRNFVPAFVSLF